MNEINEIKLPKGVESIAVKQHDDRIVIEFIPDEPKYKHGDFLMTINKLAFIFDREDENGNAYYLFVTDMDGKVDDDIQESGVGMRYCGRLKDALVADQEATRAIHDGLKSIGKRWNAEKKCIEDIPQPVEDTPQPVEELKEGDLAIFWDNVSRHYASVRIFGYLTVRGYCDINGVRWDNAIKFESKEQFEKVLRGEI